VSVTEWLNGIRAGTSSQEAGAGDVTAGTLIHRLFQFADVLTGLTDHDQPAYARALLAPEERAALADPERMVTAALGAWRSMRLRPDVAALLASGRRFHEVPFSMTRVTAAGPVVLRGAIDCVIQKDDGSILVIEFKTGRRAPSHQQQLDLYVEAVRAMFPAVAVDAHLIYPD
jgi:ATP-dependent exoDNAse (exonuclease V) beta subunit